MGRAPRTEDRVGASWLDSRGQRRWEVELEPVSGRIYVPLAAEVVFTSSTRERRAVGLEMLLIDWGPAD